MGILDGNPKNEPLHYGEIMNLWTASMTGKGMISSLEAYRNHAGDHDLIKLLGELLEQARQEVQECDKILTENGFAPPPALPERPKVEVEDIPTGARFSDQEIGAMIAISNSAGLTACSAVMGSAIREDIAAMFAKFHAQKTQLGLKILRLNKSKGWLVPPPLQLKKEPVPV